MPLYGRLCMYLERSDPENWRAEVSIKETSHLSIPTLTNPKKVIDKHLEQFTLRISRDIRGSQLALQERKESDRKEILRD